MPNPQWSDVQEIFAKAVACPPADRTSLVAELCQGDMKLRAEVESLVGVYEPAQEEIDEGWIQSALDFAKKMVASGDTVEGYHILREIHRGGQGVVFEAIQLGTHRRVALKFMLSGAFASPESKLRFEREIELASRLSHRGIVSIFDSGLAHGEYFYAMELIDGKPLGALERGSDRSVRERLLLFEKVCDAVNHAHQKGVMHRDLKPSNVLVDAAGEPHVLDFGLAKLDAGPPDQVSISGQVLGTIAYMSPEQAAGGHDVVDTRTDVHALGIVLYELLSGQLPFTLGKSLLEDLATIQHSSPRDPQMFSQDIDDEIATILLTALDKDPDRRYRTAGELGDDIHRYLAGEPIEAKRDSRIYLLRKSIERHRRPLALALGFVALLMFASVLSTVLYVEAKSTNDLAEASSRTNERSKPRSAGRASP